ncbi:hypothetical protein E2320_021030 [Naja naja]|nr:hypothetical protein E2320_021030 [Naja naja]
MPGCRGSGGGGSSIQAPRPRGRSWEQQTSGGNGATAASAVAAAAKHAGVSPVASLWAPGKRRAAAEAARVSERGAPLLSQGCWGTMPRGREDEICRKALKLLVELCSEGTVENDRCLEFSYYLRDSGRPRPADSATK